MCIRDSKYSIFKKLGVHTSEELRAMLEHHEAHPEAIPDAGQE